jgi:predicted MFS family arabinose efflux permease
MTFQPKEEFRVVACLFCVLFVGVADNQILSPLLPAIRTQVGKSSSDMGFLYTGYSFCAGLSVLFWGPLSDAFGRRKGLLSGLIVFSLGSGISFLASGYAALLCGRVLTGMGASMLSLNTVSYAADFFPYARRGWAMGSIFSSYFAALILGVPFGSWLGDKLGWNAVFGAMGGMALILFVCVCFLLPSLECKDTRGKKIQFADCARQYVGFIKTRSAVGALMSSSFASAGTMGFLAFLVLWLHDSFGIPSSKVILIFVVFGVAALLASPVAGAVADRIGKRLQFILSSLSLALLLCILPSLSWGRSLFLVFFGISLSAAFRQGPMEAVLTEIVASPSRGAFVALKNAFSQLGIGLAAFFSGILFERAGYSAVCFLAAAANLLAVVGMLFTLRERNL